MTDLVITAASVLPGTGAQQKHVTAGATITQGQAVVRDPSSGKWVLSDSNHATVALRAPQGIALNAASNGQPLTVQSEGPITIGATLTAGATYWASDTPGGICPDADVGSGEVATLLGTATSTTVLELDIQPSGVTR
jgi:hypothetical protein